MSEDKKAMEAATEEAAGCERREKNFIENENIATRTNGDGKGETYLHTRRIIF